MTNRIYVGVTRTHQRVVFRSADNPTKTSFGMLYTYVIGPFRTVRGAKFMARYGDNNPHLQTVGDAERIAKAELKKS